MERGQGGAGDRRRRQVVVIDPSRAWAEALSRLASTALDVEVPWYVPSDGSLRDVIRGTSVVVLGDGDGIEALNERAARIRALDARTKIVVLSTSDARQVQWAGAPGAAAVLSREATADSFVAVVRSLLDGTPLAASADSPQLIHSAAGPRLTRAEARVLRHVAAGCSNHEIAGSLGISTNTVRTHVQRATWKLGADSRLRAVALARESGVLDSPPTAAAGT